MAATPISKSDRNVLSFQEYHRLNKFLVFRGGLIPNTMWTVLHEKWHVSIQNKEKILDGFRFSTKTAGLPLFQFSLLNYP